MDERGFTLIELLVVIGIIGIVAAIAVPQFIQYQVQTFNTRAEHDLKSIMAAQEAYFLDYEKYAGDISSLDGFDTASDGVTVQLANQFGSDDIYGASAYHERGSKTYCYVNDLDGPILVQPGAPTTEPCIR